MKHAVKSLGGLLLLCGLVTCGGDGGTEPDPQPQPTPADPGFLRVNLTTPNTDDGALLFTLSGGELDSLEAPGFTQFSAAPSTNTLRVIVAGSISGGTVARFWVPDRNKSANYNAVLLEAAVRGGKSYLAQALEHGAGLRIGHGHGPVDHLFAIKQLPRIV